MCYCDSVLQNSVARDLHHADLKPRRIGCIPLNSLLGGQLQAIPLIRGTSLGEIMTSKTLIVSIE